MRNSSLVSLSWPPSRAVLLRSKQHPHFLPLIHQYVQVHARRQQTSVARSGLHFCQGTLAGKGVADERMPSVMNGQRAKAVPAEDPAGGVEPAAEDVTIQL